MLRAASRILPIAVLFAIGAVHAQPSALGVTVSTLTFSTLGGVTAPQTQTFVANSSGAALNVTASARYLSATSGWLTVTPSTGTTPMTISVTADPTGLNPGTYLAQVLVASGTTPGVFTQSAVVAVSLTVGGTVSGGPLSANPASVSLSASAGLASQTVAISANTTTNFNVSTSTNSGFAWLSANPTIGVTPATITINADPSGLATGTTYSGTVTLTPTTGGIPLTIPVTFIPGQVSQGLSVSTTNVTFNYQTGTSVPSSQGVLVNTPGNVNYTASVSPTTGQWLRLTSATNSLPSPAVNGPGNSYLNLVIDPNGLVGLTPGAYTATVFVTTGSLSQNILVTLNVSTSAQLLSNPGSLAFNFNPGNPNPPSQTLTISSTGAAQSFNVSVSSSGWLSSTQTGNTSGANQVTVSVIPTGLPAGNYAGTITITSTTSTLTIPVNLSVGTTSIIGMTVNPQSISLTAALGGNPVSQQLTISSSSSQVFRIVTNAGGSNWLQVSQADGSTPSTITVTAYPNVLTSAGTYSGTLVISNNLDASVITVPVTLNLSGSLLGASPSALTFTQTAGASAAVSQLLQVTGSTGTNFSISSNVSWLSTSAATGAAPAAVTISASASALSPGTYTGIINVLGPANSVNVSVTLTVTSASAANLSSTNLVFTHTVGAVSPPTQTIGVSATGAQVAFNTSIRTDSGGNWLTVTSSSTTTPATLTVLVLPGGLAAGTYRGVVTVTTTGGESRSAEIVLTISNPPPAVIRGVLHGATMQPTQISPGMIVVVRGSGLGPASGANGIVTAAGAYQTNFNDIRLLFDGVPAPLIYIRQDQINAVAPYALSGRFRTLIQVEVGGVRSVPVEVAVVDSAPGLFTLDGSGNGQAAALNENGSVNSTGNPARPDSIVTVFGTGEGQTIPLGQDGRVIVTDLRRPLLPVNVTVGGVLVEVVYAGSAPSFVSGGLQINVRLNANVPVGPNIPIVVQVGSASSSPSATIAIQP